MFTLRETESGEFIYRCHGCGWERELTAADQVSRADEAVACNEAHECAAEMRPSSDTRAPKAS